jgi:anthranilate synthase component 2
MLLIIDNYDSFTYNLYQAAAVRYPAVKVIRNDEMSVEEISGLNPQGIILSPGPGGPQDAGVCLEVIEKLGPKVPILGVCLGHQAIGQVFGAKISQKVAAMHGKQSLVFHNRKGLFKGCSLPFIAGRYHSLAVANLPDDLISDAETPDGELMAMHHVRYPIYGVQFHPESILTPEGETIIQNFLDLCR